MGKKGNKARTQSRRAREAALMAERLHRSAVDKGQEIITGKTTSTDMITQEQIEMDRAYAGALADGEFKDDVPWETLEDKDEFGREIENDHQPVSLYDKWRVLIEKDHNLEYPELGFEVFVNGTVGDEAAFIEMLARSGCHRGHSLDEADLCVFVGGADVNPELYGHVRWSSTCVSDTHDQSDMEVYAYCFENGIPMFGVCRGAQFLHVMNGGTLFQDVDNHVGDHSIFDEITRETIEKTPSVHHQMCMPNPEGGMKVLATSNAAVNRRWWSTKDKDFVTTIGKKRDIEAFFYRDTCCLGVQGHPEYANYNAYTIWCLKQLEGLIRHNPDLDWKDSVLRIKDDLLKQRESKIFTLRESEGVA